MNERKKDGKEEKKREGSEGKLARERKCDRKQAERDAHIPGSCLVFQDDVVFVSWLTMMLLITNVQNPKCQ